MTRWFNPTLIHLTSSTWKNKSTKKYKPHYRSIKHYRIIKELAKGSTGMIYLAINVFTRKYYIIKEIHQHKLQKQNGLDILNSRHPKYQQQQKEKEEVEENGIQKRRKLMNSSLSTTAIQSLFHWSESEILKSLNHDHIIQWIDAFEEGDSLYLVMESIKDAKVLMNMNDSINTFDSSILHSIFIQLVNTLEYVHEKNIIHGDIKPENILLTKENEIKLIDFGSAIQLNDEEKKKSFLLPQQQHPKTTPAFTAPEILIPCHQEKEDFKTKMIYSDIWSLGMTLYCMVYGNLPFDSNLSHFHLCQTLKSMNEIPLPKMNDHDIHPQLLDLLSKMLNMDPLKRISLDQIKSHPWFLNDI